MGKPLNLPADLIAAWAAKHDDFVRSVQVQQFLNMRNPGGPTRAISPAQLDEEELVVDGAWVVYNAV